MKFATQASAAMDLQFRERFVGLKEMGQGNEEGNR